jgi:N-methylhydantoinase A
MAFRISVDTGGTFTDVVIADGSGIRAIGKALTTPNRIFEGMRGAIEVAAQEIKLDGKALLSKSDILIYGTTRATNAVVTKSTAKTAFLTTRGFRDVLVLKEGGKYDPHDYSYDYPPPYIPRRYTFEIDERIDAQGNVVRPLDRNQAREVVRTLAERKFEAVAVCLLWSIANPIRTAFALIGQLSAPDLVTRAQPQRRGSRSKNRRSREGHCPADRR